MRGDLVLRVIAKLLIPFILVFGLYVQFHGDFGPGGGFQAGVIVAAAIIFHALIYGLPITRRAVPEWVVEIMLASGILIYAGVGVAAMLLGGNFLTSEHCVQRFSYIACTAASCAAAIG